jgi:hypothetical protein
MANSMSGVAGDVETQILATESRRLYHLSADEKLTGLWIAVWFFCSSLVVLYNKWLYSAGGFPYPLALSTMHMTCCFMVFGAVRNWAPENMRTSIMPDAEVQIPWPVYFRSVALVSVFYAGTLGTGNLAYLFSTVAFIQMMKPINTIFASFAAFAIGLDVPTFSHTVIIVIILLGIFIATSSATQINATGVGLQLISSMSEGCRLALVQSVTSCGLKLDPVTAVYHFSWISAILLGLASWIIEWPHWHAHSGASFHRPWALVCNCLLAVLLNVLSANVIKRTSGVVFALCGIVKDLSLILCSSIAFVTPLTSKQMYGYALSAIGFGMFKAYKDNLSYFKEHGFLAGMLYVAGRSRKDLL